MFRKAAILLTVLAGFGSSAQALQISFSDSIPNTTTNWKDSVELGLFDSTLGQLCKITFKLEGVVEGDIRVESLDNAPSTVTSTLSAMITLTRPDSSVIVVVVPAIVRVDNLSAFDGAIDFGGTSGNSHLNLMSGAAEMKMSPPPLGDLALFSAAGGGTINLPVIALATSNSMGSGNLATIFRTTAEAKVTVTYEYKLVPEPATLVSASVGLIGLAALRIRRRSRVA